MNHSNSEIWIHWIFVTIGRQALIDAPREKLLCRTLENFIEVFANSHGAFSVLNDHFHLLIKLPLDHLPEAFVNILKHEIRLSLDSSGLKDDFLNWEGDRYAHSVSLNQLSVEKNSINRQDVKHQKVSLSEELKFFGM
ncbi:MAG: transposase [Cyclobacteriaceae bacterium]|nr:transposase [Cyclobacteriaceae bacterium]